MAANIQAPDDDTQWLQSLPQNNPQAQQLHASMAYGLGYDPDARAKTQLVAAANGVSPVFAQANQSDLEQAAKLRSIDYSVFANTNPKTAAWLSQPENAAVAHDDIPTLTGLESAFNGINGNTQGQNDVGASSPTLGYSYFPGGVTVRHGDNAVYLPSSGQWANKNSSGDFVPVGNQNFQQKGFIGSSPSQIIANALGYGIDEPSDADRKMLYQLKGAPNGVASQVRGAIGRIMWGVTGGAVDLAQKPLRAMDQGTNAAYTKGTNLTFADSGLPQYLGRLSQVAGQMKSEYQTQDATFAGAHSFSDGVRAAASLVGGVALYMTPGGASAGAKMFFDAFGRRSEALDQQGMDPASNLALSAGAAIPDYVIGSVGHLGVPAPAGAANVMTNLLAQPAMTGTAFLAKHFGDQVVDQALGIAPIQDPNETTGDWLMRTLKQGGAESFLSGFALTALPNAIPVLQQGVENRRSGALFSALADAGQNGKLVKRLPQAYQGFVKHITADGPVDNVFIDPGAVQSYAQSTGQDPAALMQRAGATNWEQAARDARDGVPTKVQVPIDSFAANVAPDPDLMKAIQQDIAFRPTDPTPREQRAASMDPELHQTQLTAQAVAARDAVSADPSAQTVREELLHHFTTDMGFEPSTAETYADLMANRLRVAGAREGLSAEEVYRMNDYEFQRFRPGEEPTFGGAPVADPLGDVLDRIRKGDTNEPSFDAPLNAPGESGAGLEPGAGPGSTVPGGEPAGGPEGSGGGPAGDAAGTAGRHGAGPEPHEIPGGNPGGAPDAQGGAAERGGERAAGQHPERGESAGAAGSPRGGDGALARAARHLKTLGIDPKDMTDSQVQMELEEHPDQDTVQAFHREVAIHDLAAQGQGERFGQAGRYESNSVWVDPKGLVHPVDDHHDFASEQFPNEGNPVGHLRDKGWIRMGRMDTGDTYFEVSKLTPSIIEKIQSIITNDKESWDSNKITIEQTGQPNWTRIPMEEFLSSSKPRDIFPSSKTLFQGSSDLNLSPVEVSHMVRHLLDPEHFASLPADQQDALMALEQAHVPELEQMKTMAEDQGLLYQSHWGERPADGWGSDTPDFGSKEWNARYGIGKGSRPTSDRAARVRAAGKAALTGKGLGLFDDAREADAKAAEDAFTAWDKNLTDDLSPTMNGAKGFINFGPRTEEGRRRVSIGMLEGADLSTFIHEMGHMNLEMMSDLAHRPGASEQIKADWKTTLDYLGAKEGEPLTVEQHEKFARSAEAYMMEGKAPSPELASTFGRVKAWMQLIYRKVSALGVKLTPEVRGVFDRMNATDAEIDAAKSRLGGPDPMFATAEQMGVPQGLFDLYRASKAKEMATAREDLNSQAQDQFHKELSKKWQEEKAPIKEEYKAQLSDDPVYAAHRQLIEGKMDAPEGEDGQPIKLNRQQLVDAIGEDATKGIERENGKSGKAVYAKDGMDLDTAAETLLGDGHTGKELAERLRDMEPLDQTADRLAEGEMKARHGDMMADGSLADKAVEALHNRAAEDSLHMELKSLRQAEKTAGPFMDWQKKVDEAKSDAERQSAREAWEAYQADQARKAKETQTEAKAAIKLPSIQDFRDRARDAVAQMPIRDITPSTYLDGQRIASRKASEALVKGDYKTAADAKQAELLNHELFKEATKVKAEAGAIYKFAVKAGSDATRARMGLAGGDFQAQADGILNRYEFQKVSNKALDERQSLWEWAQEQVARGEQPAIDPQILNETRTANWREVPIAELRAVRDALTNIQHLAGRENTLRVGDFKADWADSKDALIGALQEAYARKPLEQDPNVKLTAMQGAAAKLRGWDAMLMRMEQMVNWSDKDDVNGIWHQMIWNPIAEAQGREGDMQVAITAKLREAMENMPKEQRLHLLDKFDVPGLDFQPTRKYIISALFNMGNEANREKMTQGMGWADRPEVLADMFKNLNANDAKFVQDTWNTVGSLWPQIADLEHRMTGLEPVQVEPKPFSLELADGKFDFDGGYYPLKGDPLRSRTGAKQESGPVVQLTDKGFERPMTSQGHTETRTAATYPLLMDYEQILGPHVTQVIQDLTHREAVAMAYKVISDPEIRTALAETMGKEYMAQFLPWLKTVVNDRNPSAAQGLDGWSKFWSASRKNVVTATMGFKLSTALVQYTGITRSLHYVGALDMAKALGQFVASPNETIDMVRGLSAEMRNRADNLDRDYREMMRDQTSGAGENFRAAVNRFAFHGIAMADTGIGIPTWLAGYNKALKDGKDEPTAILEADRAVRLTQPTAGPKDMPAIMRQDTSAKLATMFYGHFSVLYQNLRDAGHQVQGASDLPKFAARVLFSAMIPAVLGEMTLGRGPTDDENKGEWAALAGLHFAAGSIPLLRDIATPVVNHLEGKPGDYRFSPAADLIAQHVKVLESLGDQAGLGVKESHQKASDVAWLTAQDIGTVLGLPGTAQAVATGKYLSHAAAGDTANDTALDTARHFAFGYHKPK